MCAADGSERGAPPWPRTLRSTHSRPTSSGDIPSAALSNPVRSGVAVAALNGTSVLPPPLTDSPRKQRLRSPREMLVSPEPLAVTTTSFLPSACASPPAMHSAMAIVAIAVFMADLSEHPGGLCGVQPQLYAGEQALAIVVEQDVPAFGLEHQRPGRPEVETERHGVDPLEQRVVGRLVVLVHRVRHGVPRQVGAIAGDAVGAEVTAVGHEAGRTGHAGAARVVVLARDHLALDVQRAAVVLHVAAIGCLEEGMRHLAGGGGQPGVAAAVVRGAELDAERSLEREPATECELAVDILLGLGATAAVGHGRVITDVVAVRVV